jgi:formylmethanofuran dehydrogenase subunit E
MVLCDKCGEKEATYEITIRDGVDILTKMLCFSCYKASQNETIVDVKILK